MLGTFPKATSLVYSILQSSAPPPRALRDPIAACHALLEYIGITFVDLIWPYLQRQWSVLWHLEIGII